MAFARIPMCTLRAAAYLVWTHRQTGKRGTTTADIAKGAKGEKSET